MPTLNPNEATARFWDRIADRYAAKPVPDEAIYQRKLELTRALLGSDARVLELGCGTGSTAIALAPDARHVVATDVSARMLSIAEARAAEAGVPNVVFTRCGAREVRAPDASVDAVLAHSLLHLMEDWRDVISDAFRMLAPGGALVSSTVCLKESPRVLRALLTLGNRLGLLPGLKYLDRTELESTMQMAGFAIETAWAPGPRRGVFHIARKPS